MTAKAVSYLVTNFKRMNCHRNVIIPALEFGSVREFIFKLR